MKHSHRFNPFKRVERPSLARWLRRQPRSPSRVARTMIEGQDQRLAGCSQLDPASPTAHRPRTAGANGWVAALVIGASLAVACGGRKAAFEAAPLGNRSALGLNRAVAIGDPSLDRVMIVTVDASDLTTTPVTVGQNPVSLTPTVDNDGLFVLSRGVQPRRQPNDEQPSLTLIDTSETPRRIRSRPSREIPRDAGPS